MALYDVARVCDSAEEDEYASDLTDAESDEEYACAPGPRGVKRTFSDNGVVSERRIRSRIDEQLALLRAVIPNSRTDERASVLTGACEYIEKLQRQVQELHSELDTESCSDDDDDDVSSCEDQEASSPSCSGDERPVDSNSTYEWSSASRRGRSCSRVEVVSTRAGLRIHVECDKRPSLLADIMKVLEARGLNVEGAGVAFEERFVLDCVGSLVDGKQTVECRHLGARLKSLIMDQ